MSYASREYKPSQQRLVESAGGRGIDRCVSYSPSVLLKSGYRFRHHHVLKQQRGAGYWLWKPFIILETLRQLDEGDVVLYLDVDYSILEDVGPLVELARRSSVVLFANHGHVNRLWTKRDCLVLMGCDTPEYYEAEQVDAAQVLVLNSPRAREFLSTWLHWCEDPRVLTDQENVCGLPNLKGFTDHRHDQSVLSLLAKQEGLKVFRNPTDCGNHLKLPSFRVSGEPLGMPYSAEPWKDSAYGTLIRGQAELVPARPSYLRRLRARARRPLADRLRNH